MLITLVQRRLPPTWWRDRDGEFEVEHLSNLTQEETIEFGTKIGALIGLGIDGEEGAEAGAEAGAEMTAAEGINVFGRPPHGTARLAPPVSHGNRVTDHHDAVIIRRGGGIPARRAGS